jgi:hypothetical protein
MRPGCGGYSINTRVGRFGRFQLGVALLLLTPMQFSTSQPAKPVESRGLGIWG